MKVALTADFHAHLYREFALDAEEYVTTRLKELVDCLAWIRAVCQEEGATYLIVVGDLFHSRNSVPTPVMSLVYHELAKFYPIQVILVAGNHDQWSLRFTSLDLFVQCAMVVKSPTITALEGREILFIPYIPDEEAERVLRNFEGKYDLVVAHLSVCGAILHSGVEYRNGSVTASSLETYFPETSILLGHFHIPQVMGRVEYLGVPIQHSFADSGVVPGIHFLDFETGARKWVENTISPRFVRLDYEEDGLLLNERDYFWITTHDPKEVEKELERVGFPRFRVRISPKPKETVSTERVLTPLEMDYIEMVRRYAEATASGPVKSDIVRKGEEVVREVTGAWH